MAKRPLLRHEEEMAWASKDPDVIAALHAVAQASVVNLTPTVLELGPQKPSVWQVIAAAGLEVNADLDQIAVAGTPTGRVWAVMLLETRDPGRAQEHITRMLDDPSPIMVNTCLVGFRTTRQWAASRRGGNDAGQRARRFATLPDSVVGILVLLAWVGACIAVGWLRSL